MDEEMAAVRRFMEQFREAEHAAYRAWLLEADFDRFAKKRDALMRLGAAIPFSSTMPRWRDDPLPPPDEAEQTLRTEYAPRRLLRLEAHTLPDGRRVYAAFVSGTHTIRTTGRPPSSVAECYIVARGEAGWQIISRRSAPNPAFPYWETTGGEDIALPETPDAVLELEDEE
ncbi:MAG: hypothetical protein Kow0077_23050 [Anaerolineae bacterium]